MPRMTGPFTVLLVCALCCLMTTRSDARRISSDPTVPDTARVLEAEDTRVPMVALPIWIGVDDEYALYRSRWRDLPRVGPRGRFGLTIHVPMPQVGVRSWTSMAYAEDELETKKYFVVWDSVGYAYRPQPLSVSTSLFSLRTGLDRVAGNEARPLGFLGGGVGFGYGAIDSEWRGRTERWVSLECALRGGLYLYSSRNSRFGLVGLGILGYRGGSETHDAIVEVQLGVTMESALQLPKRFVEQP